MRASKKGYEKVRSPLSFGGGTSCFSTHLCHLPQLLQSHNADWKIPNPKWTSGEKSNKYSLIFSKSLVPVSISFRFVFGKKQTKN